jgi:hypothetical protein
MRQHASITDSDVKGWAEEQASWGQYAMHYISRGPKMPVSVASGVFAPASRLLAAQRLATTGLMRGRHGRQCIAATVCY